MCCIKCEIVGLLTPELTGAPQLYRGAFCGTNVVEGLPAQRTGDEGMSDGTPGDEMKASGGQSRSNVWLGGTVKDLLHNEKVKEALTFEEMRTEIYRLRFHDAMVRQVMDMADMCGLSAEDRYVALAYYALLERSKLKAVILEDAMTRPAPRMVTPNAKLTSGALTAPETEK